MIMKSASIFLLQRKGAEQQLQQYAQDLEAPKLRIMPDDAA